MTYLKFALMLSCCVSAVSRAEGLLSSLELPASERQVLVIDVDKARQSSPRAFSALESLASQMPKLDARKRGRYVPITQPLRAMGKELLFPALEMLVLKAPSVNLSPSAELSLKIGLIEATGELKDGRALAVWKALLRSTQTQTQLYRSAAEALGRLGTDEAVAELMLQARGNSEKAQAILWGMGSCRRLDVATHLASALETRGTEAYTLSVIKGLSLVGNSWAWKLEKDADSGTTVRNLAARALLQAFSRGPESVRQAASNALMVVDAPQTRTLLEAALQRAREEERAALKGLLQRFKNNPVR